MSFMEISGMVSHCHVCKIYSTVDFVDGTRWTQIGDGGVYEQKELNVKYRTTGKYHIEGLLCSTCYQAYAPDDIEKKRWSAAFQLRNIAWNIKNIKIGYEQKVTEYLSNILMQWLDEYSFKLQETEVFNSIIYDKNINMKGRLKRVLSRHMHGAYEQYLRKADEMLSVDSLPQVISSVEEYIKDCNPILEEAKAVYHELGKQDFMMWVKYETEQPINLNPHICYPDTTVRTPKPEERFAFYYNTKVHVESMNPKIKPLGIKKILDDVFRSLNPMTLLRNKLSSEVAEELLKF